MAPDKDFFTFMQDGAPAHSAKDTLCLIDRHFGEEAWVKNIWPGNSCDLNPIEHVWAILQDSVLVEPSPRNRAELIDRVNEAWN